MSALLLFRAAYGRVFTAQAIGRWLPFLLLLVGSVHAQIIADPSAPGRQRPTILSAPNGRPLVNIQTPSAAGVSRNSYIQFDIDPNGAILNNSRNPTQTQLGGWVNGNPWLATGSARIILNEVNSNDPSRLYGPLEVAGQRAQVVVANPSGITCNGCGFINASRVTLTTGRPVFGAQGSLESWRVTGGMVSIDGKGMNASDANYADILARHVQINAGLWAKYANVSAGSAEVKVDADGNPGAATPLATTEKPPEYLVDVAELGGMYAGHIFLRGTEAGLGVVMRNDGNLIASGDIAITADGQLVSKKALLAGGNLQIQAGSVKNSGEMSAGQAVHIDTGKVVNQEAGKIQGSSIDIHATDRVKNLGLINGGDVGIDGSKVSNAGNGRIYGDSIAIQADVLRNQDDAAAGTAPVIGASRRIDLGVKRLKNSDGALIYSGGDLAIGGTIATTLDPSTGKPLRRASGRAQVISNKSASIEAQGNGRIDSVLLKNRNVHLVIGVQAEAPTYEELIAPTWTDWIFKAVYCANLQATTSYCGEPADQGGRTLQFEDYTIYRIYGSPSRSVVQSAKPSILRTGGDLTITGDGTANSKVINQDSQLLAGGNLGLNGTKLNNTATTGTYRVDYSGNYQHTSVESCGGGHCREWQTVGNYAPAPLIQTIALPTVSGLPSNFNDHVRSGAFTTTVPNNALFKPSSSLKYLIETDPAFASYRNWLSSDYMLNAMGMDQTLTQKRLGDGFYEQKLVRDQVAQLTGRRFLDGYSDDEAEYLALMQSGLTFAQAQQLVPGVALSAAQMAQLTSDIVWLVEEQVTVTGADGKPITTTALVPRLYVKVRPGDLDGSGALLSGDSVKAELAGDLNNSATIAGRKLVRISAQDINNAGSVQGKDIDLQASRDLKVQGGTVVADNSLRAQAGRDLQVQTTTVSSQTKVSAADAARGASFSRTGIDRVASLVVTGKDSSASASDTSLQLSAGRNVDIAGAVVGNAGAGRTQISAGQDIKLGTVTTTVDNRAVAKETGGSGFAGLANLAADAIGKPGATQNYSKSFSQQEQGSSIQTQGDIRIQAGQDIKLRATEVKSDNGAIQLDATRDIQIANGENHQSRDDQHHYSSSGTFSSSTTTLREGYDRTTAVASTLSGKSVTASAGQDVSVQGSAVIADQDVSLNAARDVKIAAATETRSQIYNMQENKSGMFGSGGVGISIGSRDVTQDNKTESTNAAGSLVGSVTGHVSIKAGQNYAQTGSDVIAPGGDVNIHAKQVSITEARETTHTSMQSRVEQSGVTVAISNPVITAVQTADQMKQAADNTSDKRMKALAAANTALVAQRAAKAVQAGQGTTIDGKPNQIPTGKTGPDGKPETRDATLADQMGGVDLSISYGHASSQSSFESTSNSARGSTVAAGRNVNISASGAGRDSTLLVQGSQVAAGNQASLSAEGDLQLQAANNSASITSRDSSSSASAGMSIGTSGMLATASASRAKGNADGNDSSWTQTRVDAGQQVTLQSGEDTTLRGATVSAPKVTADVGGKLNIESLQDTSTYHSDQKSIGGSIAVGAGKVSGNVAYNTGKIDSDYAGVAEQSGIKAGDAGFDVKVGKDAVLTGGAITSTQKAVDEGKNHYEAQGSTTLTDIGNQTSYSASSVGVNIGTGFDPAGKLAPTGTGVGIGSDGDQKQSVTKAAISGIAGNKDARTSDAEAALPRIFDAEKVQKEVNAQVQITQTFGREASKVMADYATAQEQAARKKGDTAEAEKWKEGGAYRVLMQTAVGGLAGGAAGAVGAGSAAALAPKLTELQDSVAKQLKEAGASDAVANGASALLANLAAGGIGAVAGGGSATAVAGAVNVDANNRQLHFDEKELIAKKANGDKKAEERLTKAACYEVKCWAQFPEGSPLYAQYYVSAADAAGLAPELAWVKEQQTGGMFIYTPFQKMTDKVATTTGMSSVAGKGTFNGEFISKPSQPLTENHCVTAECAAFMEPFRGHNPPDYLSVQGNIYVASGGFAVNLHNGDTFGQWGLGRAYPGYSVTPGFSVGVGTIVGGGNAQITSDFLKGGGVQGNVYVPPLPAIPLLNVGGGVNHSYGGRTAIEVGASTQPGASVAPIGYGFAIGERSGATK